MLIYMLLKKLIKNIPSKIKFTNIKGLSSNSKKIKKGFIFFALRGNNFNGEKFIDEAIINGASVVVCSKKCKLRKKKIPLIKTSDPRYLLSLAKGILSEESPQCDTATSTEHN